MSDQISIEPFRGDYDQLERFAHVSRRDEYGQASFPNFYRPAFLRYLFGRIPAELNDHLLAAYRGDEIVGFMGNLPQRFHFKGTIYRATYSCLLVVRKEMLRRGLATAMIREALRINQKCRYDFALFTLETGHRSTKMIEKFRREGNRVEQVKTFRVIARILDLERVASSEGLKTWERAAIKLIGGHRPARLNPAVRLREYRPDDLESCLALLNRYRQTADLVLVWDAASLAGELLAPDVVQTLVCEKDGRIAGMLAFIYHDHLARTRERWAWVHHLAFPDLSPAEKAAFVQAFLEYAQNAGCLGVIEWTRNYFPLKPFYRARFFPYFRAVNLVSWTFNPALSLASLSGVYEIQV